MNVAVAPSTATSPDRPTTRCAGSRRRLAVAVAAAALLAAACTSDPGPKRVAQDIIEAESFRNPDLDEECLLAELRKFDDDALRDIESDLGASNSDRNDTGAAALLAYQRSLEICS